MTRWRKLSVVGSMAIVCVLTLGTALAATVPVLVYDHGVIFASSRLVFRNPRGLHTYYQFYDAPEDGTFWYNFSSDGVNWANRGGAGDGAGSASLWVYDTGSQLVVYFVSLDQVGSKIQYQRGTIADTAQLIAWDTFQVVDPGGNNARNLGLSVTRTANGRPVITAVKEVYVNPTYRYEVDAWGANADTSAPSWTRTTLMAAANSLSLQDTGYTSAYAASGDYVSVAASAARGLNPSLPWDASWVRASWSGSAWTIGPVTVLRSGEAGARPPSLVLDEFALPNAIVGYPGLKTPQLIHYHGTTADGTQYGTFVLSQPPSGSVLTAYTLSIDRSTSPSSLKAIYHYGATNIYWQSSHSSPSFGWGPENTIPWSLNAVALCSSQRDFVGAVHGCVSTSSPSYGVYYFSV